MLAVFSSPASANRAYYVSRLLGFSTDKQPSKAEMIERVTTKYGAPTAIGDGRMYYFYKAGKLMSVKQKYTPATALEALNAPINPKVAVAKPALADQDDVAGAQVEQVRYHHRHHRHRHHRRHWHRRRHWHHRRW